MRIPQISFKEATRVLRENGYECKRVKGSHHFYVGATGCIVLNLKLNTLVWHRICKEHGIVM